MTKQNFLLDNDSNSHFKIIWNQKYFKLQRNKKEMKKFEPQKFDLSNAMEAREVLWS